MKTEKFLKNGFKLSFLIGIVLAFSAAFLLVRGTDKVVTNTLFYISFAQGLLGFILLHFSQREKRTMVK